MDDHVKFGDLQFGAGVVLRRFDPGRPIIDDDDILCATTNGVSITVKPDIRDLADNIVNAPKGTKELTYFAGWIAEMRFTSVSVTADLLATALGAGNAWAGKVVGRQIKLSDFFDLWWVGEEGRLGYGFVAVKFLDALSVNGVTMTTRPNGKGTVEITIRGHLRLTNADKPPVEIYSFPDFVEIPVYADSLGGIVIGVKVAGLTAALAGGMALVPCVFGENVKATTAPASTGKTNDALVSDENVTGAAQLSALGENADGAVFGDNVDGDDSVSKIGRHKTGIATGSLAKIVSGDSQIARHKSQIVLANKTDALSSAVPAMGKSKGGAVVGENAGLFASLVPVNSDVKNGIVADEKIDAMPTRTPSNGKAQSGTLTNENIVGDPSATPTLAGATDGTIAGENVVGEANALPKMTGAVSGSVNVDNAGATIFVNPIFAKTPSGVIVGDNVSAYIEIPGILAGTYAVIPNATYIEMSIPDLHFTVDYDTPEQAVGLAAGRDELFGDLIYSIYPEMIVASRWDPDDEWAGTPITITSDYTGTAEEIAAFYHYFALVVN